MAIDARDVGELQNALNDAAGKASALWIAFVTFELYLAIAFGSVTHRDLFLENPIKLPVLNVELSLVAFFVVAPILLVIFHFYVFLQLLALARKAQDYDALLRQAAPVAADRQFLRQRLDAFPVLQFLVGPFSQRTGSGGFSLRLMTWITLVAAPVLVLLQAQITFLPYHLGWAVWVQRIVLLIDLAVIWYFWDRVRSSDALILGRVPSPVWQAVGAVATICIVLFSVVIASFPGERAEEKLWLRTALFEGEVDEVSGRPRSWFSNRLVLTDQNFYEPDKHDKLEISRSFRGRDLRGAVLNRADLRKADFTGAMLNQAHLEFAQLQKSRFGCANRGTGQPADSEWPADGCTWLQGVLLREAKLQGAFLDSARMQGARLMGAELHGASLNKAKLRDANFEAAKLHAARLEGAELHGAWLDGVELQGARLNSAALQGASLRPARLGGGPPRPAQLQGASLTQAQLQGARLNEARLQGASLEEAGLQGSVLAEAKLQGAQFDRAELQGARLDGARLQGASLTRAWLQGASLTRAWLQGASLNGVRTWRVNGQPSSLDLVDVREIEPEARPWNGGDEAFANWRAQIADTVPLGPQRDSTIQRLEVLSPAPGREPNDILDLRSIPQPQGAQLADLLVDLACRNDVAPHLARGLLRNGRIAATRSHIAAVAEQLRKGRNDPSACPGVRGFIADDWAALDGLVAAAPKPAGPPQSSQ